jgi:hypothetical protein
MLYLWHFISLSVGEFFLQGVTSIKISYLLISYITYCFKYSFVVLKLPRSSNWPLLAAILVLQILEPTYTYSFVHQKSKSACPRQSYIWINYVSLNNTVLLTVVLYPRNIFSKSIISKCFAAEVIQFCLKVTQWGILIQAGNYADERWNLIGLFSRMHGKRFYNGFC